MDDDDVLAWLERWYESHCDGEWEHEKGVRIDTIDNPGWAVEADVEIASHEPVNTERSGRDWVRCEIREGRFVGHCGPGNLKEVLEILRSWLRAA